MRLWLANLIDWIIWLVHQFQLVHYINIILLKSYWQLAIIINYKVPQHMFKNVPHVKKNVARMQVKHLLNVRSLDIIWSSFLCLTLNKLLRKPVLVINPYGNCSGTGLLLFLLSYNMWLHRKVAIWVYFCKVAGENGKKLLPEIFFKLRKRNLPHVWFLSPHYNEQT